MSKLSLFLWCALMSWGWGCQTAPEEPLEVAPITLIPQPLKIEPATGHFVFNKETKVFIETAEQAQMVQQFLSQFKRIGTWAPTITQDIARADVVLKANVDLPIEGYTLDVSDRITIQASSDAGFFYGLQTLVQLLPPAFYSTEPLDRPQWGIPAVHIEDAPAFGWRGFMLDVSRHWFDKQQVKQVLDIMASLKMNRFHWHLTDDQGWRVEINAYPKLTQIGAWRVNHTNYDENISDWWGRPVQQPGEQADYGGYYTQEDIREIVDYAKLRNIEVIPEIDMPGHAQATMLRIRKSGV